MATRTKTPKAHLGIIEITPSGEVARHTITVNDADPAASLERAESLRLRYAASGNTVEVRPFTSVA